MNEGMPTKGYELTHLAMADGGMYAGHDETMQPQSDGTTIMAIKYQGGILLGADSRSSNVSLRPILTLKTISGGERDLTMFLRFCAGYVHW